MFTSAVEIAAHVPRPPRRPGAIRNAWTLLRCTSTALQLHFKSWVIEDRVVGRGLAPRSSRGAMLHVENGPQGPDPQRSLGEALASRSALALRWCQRTAERSRMRWRTAARTEQRSARASQSTSTLALTGAALFSRVKSRQPSREAATACVAKSVRHRRCEPFFEARSFSVAWMGERVDLGRHGAEHDRCETCEQEPVSRLHITCNRLDERRVAVPGGELSLAMHRLTERTAGDKPRLRFQREAASST
jgi:hypothetical protein